MKKLSFFMLAATLIVSLPFSSLASSSSSASGSEVELTGAFFRIGWADNQGGYESTQALRADGSQFATVPGNDAGNLYSLRDISVFVYGSFQADKDYMLDCVIYQDTTQWNDGKDVDLTYYYSNGTGTRNTTETDVVSGSYEKMGNLYSGGISGYAYRFRMQATVNGDTSPCLTVYANMDQPIAIDVRHYTVSNVHVYEIDRSETGVITLVDLVKNLPNKIIELFVPPADLISNVYNEWDIWLEDHFGILYYPFHFANTVIFALISGYVPPRPSTNVLDYVNRYSTLGNRPGVLVFPELTLNLSGSNYTIWNSTEIDLQTFFQTYDLTWLIALIQTIIGFLVSVKFLGWICDRMNTIFPDNAIFGFLASVFDKIAGRFDFLEGIF